MDPDVYTTLWIVNATKQSLIVGPNIHHDKGFNNQYQMASWFPETVGQTLSTRQATNTYKLQFEKGVGDEDDAADSAFALSSTPSENAIWYRARSDHNSGHYVGFTIVNLPSPFIVCSDAVGGLWSEIADTSGMKWYNSAKAGSFLDTQYLHDKNGYFMLVDALSVLGPDVGKNIYDDITHGKLTNAQKDILYDAVVGFMQG